jgi:hypothetical protein
MKNHLKKVIYILFFSLILYNQSNSQSIFVGDTTGPSIIYVNIIPNYIIPYSTSSPSVFDVDIDFDSIKDIRFWCFTTYSHTSSSESFLVLSLDTNTIQFAHVINSNNIDTLVKGSIIDSSLNWSNNFYGILYETWQNYSLGTDSIYGICTKPNTYIGFRKETPTDTIYGWVLISMIYPFTINSFAISKNDINNINQTFSSNNISVFPNPTSESINIISYDTRFKKYQLVIYNEYGQMEFKKDIEFIKEYSVDLRNYKSGLHIIMLNNDKEQIIKKIVLHRE